MKEKHIEQALKDAPISSDGFGLAELHNCETDTTVLALREGPLGEIAEEWSDLMRDLGASRPSLRSGGWRFIAEGARDEIAAFLTERGIEVAFSTLVHDGASVLSLNERVD